MSSKTSAVWLYFLEIGQGKVKCELCNKNFSYKYGSSSNLKRHLTAKHLTIELGSGERFATDRGNQENNGSMQGNVIKDSHLHIKIFKLNMIGSYNDRPD